MDDKSADTTEKKWKLRFFLLLGVVLGEMSGRLLFFVSGSAAPTTYVVLSSLWLTILAWGCWAHLRKRNFLAAAVLGFSFALFLGAFFFVEHVGFPVRKF